MLSSLNNLLYLLIYPFIDMQKIMYGFYEEFYNQMNVDV